MKNYIQRGDRMVTTATTAIASGDLVIVGALAGVAETSAAVGEEVTLLLKEVFALPKAAGAITQGAVVYWDAGADKVTLTAEGNTKIGHAFLDAADAAATVAVRLG